MNDFIGVYDEVFSKEYCDEVILRMDKSFKLGFGFTRQQSGDSDKHSKDDNQIYPNHLADANSIFSDELSKDFNAKFWGECYKRYTEQYSVLNDLDEHTIYGNKLQKTVVGGGYHIWHSEHSRNDSRRLLAYIVYLNDVEEGGETEFLYQHKRVKPKQGTVVIFPAGFTHTHRGNPPLSNTKYIMTGWVEY
jgi:hypothetical protein